MDRKKELLTILQEEAAEVTQCVSKLFRFGEESFHPKDRKKVSNIHHLEDEIGDILGVLKLLIIEGYVDGERIEQGAHNKLKKLEKFMNNPAVDNSAALERAFERGDEWQANATQEDLIEAKKASKSRKNRADGGGYD